MWAANFLEMPEYWANGATESPQKKLIAESYLVVSNGAAYTTLAAY